MSQHPWFTSALEWQTKLDDAIADATAAGKRLMLVVGLELPAADFRRAAGRLQPLVGQTFPLEQAAEAHLAIERRATVGKTLLLIQAMRSAGLEARPA